MSKNLRAIRRKIRTVRNIWQITRAMQMVSASKLRRLQPRVEASRAYLEYITEVVGQVAASVPAALHPYLQQRPARAVGLILVAGDKGLAGSHNVNVFRAAEKFMQEHAGVPVRLIAVGNKVQEFARRRKWEILFHMPAPATGEGREALQAACLGRELFETEQIDELHIVYTEFLSPLRRPVRVRQLLPITPQTLARAEEALEYIFEPPAEQLLAALLPRALEAQIVNMILQAAAAEHAARMTAMSAATQNAEELRQILVRDLNRARQEKITTELLEVVTAADALTQED